MMLQLVRLPASILALVLAGGLAAAAETGPSVSTDVPAVAAEPSREARLDALFESLKAEEDADVAGGIEDQILRIWLASGSDTVDLLMDWTLSAMERKQYPRALDFLDRIILMEPDYVEGWNKRATVHFLMDDYGQSLVDIGKVLELEPRHFGALSGLGIMLRSLGDKERAKAAFRAALDVDPHLGNVREELETLEAETGGRDT
jgi:tetratricopeptide (TPR) repeat protein